MLKGSVGASPASGRLPAMRLMQARTPALQKHYGVDDAKIF